MFSQLLYPLGGTRPPVPTRSQLITVETSGMQGLVVNTPSYGPANWWDPYITSPELTAADRQAVYAAKCAAGDKHMMLAVSWNYAEPGVVFGTLKRALAGFDGTKNWTRFLQIYDEVLDAGFYVSLHLAGDGLSQPQNPDGSWNYNDPTGWTYGWQWLMANLATIRAQVGDTRAAYTLWCDGFDACTPDWAGPTNVWQRMNQYLQLARQVLGSTAAISIYLSSGYWAWSGENDDYATPDGQNVDHVYYEGPIPFGPPAPYPGKDGGSSWDQLWQISKRLLLSLFVRPADQPADDDPGTMPGIRTTPRGPLGLCFVEFATEPWVRSQISVATVVWQRAYIKAMGWPTVG